MTTPSTDTAVPDRYVALEATVRPPTDPDAAVDVECFMTTDGVDADDEIVLPAGADFSRFQKNPVVLLCHGYGQSGSHYALPIGMAVWWRRVLRGVMAGVKFADSTAMGREVKALFKENFFRSFSIGFRSLEASPLTREEAATRPDWQAAYERTRGKILVHRRWQLLELSATPLPANSDALVARYQAKGLPVPSWLQLEKRPMDDAADATDEVPGGDHETEAPEPQDDEVNKAVKPAVDDCDCGKPSCPKCSVTDKATQVKPLADEVTDDEEEPDDSEDDGDSEEEAGAGFRKGDHVKMKARHYKGFGVVQGVHTRGHVPNVPQDIQGTPDDPAARVKCYKAFGDGHVATEDHVGVKCAHMTKLAQQMKPPTKKALPAKPVSRKAQINDDFLPPMVPLTDDDVRRKQIEEAEKASERAVEEVRRILGVV